MNQYDRRKMVMSLILNARAACSRCGEDVSKGYNSIDEFINKIEVVKIDPLQPKNTANARLMHKLCTVVNIDRVMAILQKGPIGGWQNCYVCGKTVTDLNEVSDLAIYKHKNSFEYLVHVKCVKDVR